MPITVNTNVTAMRAQGNTNRANMFVSQSMQRLSSGLRINSAKDDAAGLAISNRLTSQIRGMDVAMRNASDGISVAQTAEGALQTSTNILQRMRDLALQAANDSNSDTDRANLNKEIVELQKELTRIADTTSFGNQKLLDGTYTGKAFQIGANANETIDVSIAGARTSQIGEYKLTMGGTAMNTAAATNGIGAETDLTLTSNGVTTSSITWSSGDSAKDIAAAINSASSTSGLDVTANASNEMTIDSLSAGGAISFTLNSVSVAASVSSANDLTALAEAINGVSGQTGITAELRILTIAHL